MRSKAQRKFDIDVLYKRAKVLTKKRHGKSVSIKDIKKIWKDYVEYGIIRKVLHYGVAEVDENFKIEMIGKPYSERYLKVLERGKFVIKRKNKWNRLGYTYKLRVVDKQCKGQIIFEPHAKFKKRAIEKLETSSQHYRIEK